MKRYTNRLVAGLLVLLMLVAAFPVAAFAETTETEGKSDVENVQAHEAKETEPLEMSEAGTPPAVRAPQQGTTKNLTVEVTLDTTMRMYLRTSETFTFKVNGQLRTVNVPEDCIAEEPKTFTFTFSNVSFQPGKTEADAEVSLATLPSNLSRYYMPVKQDYNKAERKLNVVLGRDIYLRVSPMPDEIQFDTFGTLGAKGFGLTLYDEQHNPVAYAQPIKDPIYYVIDMYKLRGVKPGNYTLEFTHVPEAYKNYATERPYKLVVDPNGSAKLEIYQKDGYALACGTGGECNPDPTLNGVKTPFFLLLAKKSKAKKVIVDGDNEVKTKDVEQDEIIEYKITKTIYDDHNAVVYFANSLNLGTKVDQSFQDELDENLEFQPGSLQLTLGGNPTTDFEASYDPITRTIHVKDVSKVKIIPFGPRSTPLGDQPLEVTFQVKVLKAEDTIVNKVDDSTTELIPFKVKVKVNKIWQDNDDQAGKRPTSVTIVLKGDGVEKARKTISAQENWEWTFTDLPKKNDAGNDIVYTVEELHVDGYKTKTTGDATQGFTVTNTLKPTVEVTAKKVWVGDANHPDARPASVEFILKADGVVKDRHIVTEGDHWTWTFRNLPKENDDGTDIVYTIEETPVEGYKTTIAGDAKNGFTVTNRLIPPPPTTHPKETAIPVEKVWEDDGNRENLRPTSVTVRLYADGKDTGKSVVLTETNDWKGQFLHLPEFNAGKKIVYTIEEERVAHYASTVTGNQTDGFTVTNRVEEPPKPPTPPTPPIPPTPPVIIVPRIPRAGVGA